MKNTSQPYVVYRISAGVADKGVGFVIKTAVNAYLKHHGLSGRVNLSTKTSDDFEAFLEIYPGGSMDLNMTALEAHLSKSGRMPTTRSKKPEIHIEPVVPEEYAQHLATVEQVPVDEYTARELQRIAGENTRLQNAVEKQQEVISGKASRIASLEKRLEKVGNTETFTTPQDAIVKGYLSKSLESLLDVFADFETLVTREALSDFLEYRGKGGDVPDFVLYVRERTGREFKDESELEQWTKGMTKARKVEDLPRYKALVIQIETVERDRQALRAVKELGASEEVISAIKSALQGKDIESLRADQRTLQETFHQDQETYGLIEPLKVQHQAMTTVTTRSVERETKGLKFPVLLYHGYGNEEEYVDVYMPSFDIKGPLHQVMRELIQGVAEKKKMELSPSQETGSDFSVLRISRKSGTQAFSKLAHELVKAIPGQEMFNAFGLRPEVISVEGSA